MHKRGFLRTLGGAAVGLVLSPAQQRLFAALPPVQLAARDDFWSDLRARYLVPTEFIHLEHGYYAMQAQPVLERYLQHIRDVNAVSSHYMCTVQGTDKARGQNRLAALAGCTADDLIITRNTTESLDTVISGFDWQPGDEAVMAVHDYGAMLDHFTLMQRRWGIVNTRVTVPLDPQSDDEVVQVYANAITPRTKLLTVCHMISITGHVLPVRKICDMAHARRGPVMVNGAHAFAATDIRKLNHTGTHPVTTDLALEDVIAFHEAIGVARRAVQR